MSRKLAVMRYLVLAATPILALHCLSGVFGHYGLLTQSGQIACVDTPASIFYLSFTGYLFLALIYPFDRHRKGWSELPKDVRTSLISWRAAIVGFGAFCYGVSIPALFDSL